MAVGTQNLDVIVVGAGFSGIYLVHNLGNVKGFNVRAFEMDEEIGGTWNWNRYPGARVDVPSREYMYSFDEKLEQDYLAKWSEVYCTQPELLRYLNYAADYLNIRGLIECSSTVTGATWNEVTQNWTVEISKNGKTAQYSAKFLVAASGCLSIPGSPKFEGLNVFPGEIYHSARWPKEGVDFRGKRVAVIGTGSSGVQSITEIAKQPAHLTVFQRTATYTVPCRTHSMTPELADKLRLEIRDIRKGAYDSPGAMSEEQVFAEMEKAWDQGSGLGFQLKWTDLLVSEEANAVAQKWYRQKVHSIVKDPVTADLLCPKHIFGVKRLVLDTGYLPTFNRPNVSVVSIAENPIERFTENGMIRLADGTEHGPCDAVELAVGFDAMTGSMLKMNIVGRDGLILKEAWLAGPRTYLGLSVHGFPNLFSISGPGSPSVLTNMVVSLEQHVEWVSDCIAYLNSHGFTTIEADLAAQDAWVAHCNQIAAYTLYPKGNSWYMGANVPGKPRVFMPYIGGFNNYRAKCEQVARGGYVDGFKLSK